MSYFLLAHERSLYTPTDSALTIFRQGKHCLKFFVLNITWCFLEQWPLAHQIFVSIVLTTKNKVQEEVSNLTSLILFLVYTDLFLKITCDYKSWINIEKLLHRITRVWHCTVPQDAVHTIRNGSGWCSLWSCAMYNLHGHAWWHHLYGGAHFPIII